MTWIIPLAVLVAILYWILKPIVSDRLYRRKMKNTEQYELDEHEEKTYYHKY